MPYRCRPKLILILKDKYADWQAIFKTCSLSGIFNKYAFAGVKSFVMRSLTYLWVDWNVSSKVLSTETILAIPNKKLVEPNFQIWEQNSQQDNSAKALKRQYASDVDGSSLGICMGTDGLVEIFEGDKLY